MDGHAGHLHAGGECVTDPVRTGERRQQRRVQIEKPALEGRQHRRPDDAHVARQHDQLRSDGRQGLSEEAVLLGPSGLVATWRRRYQERLDPLLHGPVQRRARAIGEDQGYLGVERATLGDGVQGTQVAAGSRDADRDPMCHAAPPPPVFRQNRHDSR